MAKARMSVEECEARFPPDTKVRLMVSTKTHTAGSDYTVKDVRAVGPKLVWVVVYEADGVHTATFEPEALEVLDGGRGLDHSDSGSSSADPSHRGDGERPVLDGGAAMTIDADLGPTSALFATNAPAEWAPRAASTWKAYVDKFGEFDGLEAVEALATPWTLQTLDILQEMAVPGSTGAAILKQQESEPPKRRGRPPRSVDVPATSSTTARDGQPGGTPIPALAAPVLSATTPHATIGAVLGLTPSSTSGASDWQTAMARRLAGAALVILADYPQDVDKVWTTAREIVGKALD